MRSKFSKGTTAESTKRARRPMQLSMLPKGSSAYGGTLRNLRSGRLRGRPVSSKDSMHLVLRSTLAKGSWSFLKPGNAAKVNSIIAKFAFVYGVRVLSMANVGNHLHLHIRLHTRVGFNPFIRAITGAIAMAVTGKTRWNKNFETQTMATRKFWDHRPFTRIVIGFKALNHIKDYIKVNQLEAWGVAKSVARQIHSRLCNQTRALEAPGFG